VSQLYEISTPFWKNKHLTLTNPSLFC
jgi:hypothetical protein